MNELMVPSEQLSHYQPPSAEDLCSHFAPDGQVSLDPSKVEWGWLCVVVCWPSSD